MCFECSSSKLDSKARILLLRVCLLRQLQAKAERRWHELEPGGWIYLVVNLDIIYANINAKLI